MNDQKMFLTLCKQERDNVYRYIFLRVGYHRETSEDLTQDVFLKVWQSWGSYDEGKASMRTWTFRIAHNVLIDYYRKQGRVETTEIDTAVVAVEVDELDPGLKETLLKALEKLTTDERELVVLRYIEGLDTKQVAHIINKSNIATKVAAHRALTKLKKLLNEEVK